ncbi:MAG: hypothetical protein AMXMBFR47_16010 [Planctomycetota bacterium]
MGAISPEVLELLACPVPECRQALREADGALICTGCGRRYRVEDRWPVLIPEEAESPSRGQGDAAGAPGSGT